MNHFANNSTIKANGIFLRLINKSDAEFILGLRTDSRLSQHISQTSSKLEDQIDWIIEYKKREKNNKEFYFIYEDTNRKPWGVIRLYDLKNESFTVGSWLCYPGNTNHIAVRAWILAVEFGFENLKYKTCLIDVRKKNLYVLYFLKLFKPNLIKENQLNYYFSFSKNSFFKHSNTVTKLLNITLKND